MPPIPDTDNSVLSLANHRSKPLDIAKAINAARNICKQDMVKLLITAFQMIHQLNLELANLRTQGDRHDSCRKENQ